MPRLAIALLALTLSACPARSAGVASPEHANALALAATVDPPLRALEHVLPSQRGVVLLEVGGAMRVGADGPRGDVADTGAVAAKWVDAVEIDSFEGQGRWQLALDAKGTIYRLRGGGGLEAMNDRLGVSRTVRSMARAGEGLALLDDAGLSVVERAKVSRVSITGRRLAASRSAVAVLGEGVVRVVELGASRVREFALEDVALVTLTEAGFLAAATPRAIYRENGSGSLVLAWVAGDDVVALAADGERLWFAEGGRVGVLDGGRAALSVDLAVGTIRRVVPGDDAIWVLGDTSARRFATEDHAGWPPEVERIARARCEGCHRVGGEAPFSLASSGDFARRKRDVRRAIEARTMPPGGGLDEAERARLLAWLLR